MRLKILPLAFWMVTEDLLADCLASGRYPPVPPRFDRPGVYLEGATCWFELGDGRAFAYDVSQVRYQLALAAASQLTERQAAALQGIVAQRLATKTQRTLLRHYQEALACRAVYRNSRLVQVRWRDRSA